jgi:hypothetical protein
VLCRLVTIVGKYKTNILIIQIHVTICKRPAVAQTAFYLCRRPFIYIGAAQKGRNRDFGNKNESLSAHTRRTAGRKRPRTASRGKNAGFKL